MNKTELLAEIKKIGGKECTNACAQHALESVLEAIKKGLKKDGAVQLIGFGTFKVSKRAPRTGINPRTKEKIKIKASQTITFKSGAALKESV